MKCIPDLVKNIYVLRFKDLRREILNIYVKPVLIQGKVKNKAIKRYVVKAQRVYGLLRSRLGVVKMMPSWSFFHPFYRELLNIGGVLSYEESRKKVLRMIHVLSNLWSEYKANLGKCSNVDEAKKYVRIFIGRSLSIARRIDRDLDVLDKAVSILKSTPCINPEEPIIVIAGMPQTGKSTLTGKISTVKPKVSPYPFTTKNVILGHLKLMNSVRLQIMDTPGILDRPLEDLNEIERKAIAAINHLATVMVFLIDPREDSYYPLESQLYVYKTVSTILRNNSRIIVAINKMDMIGLNRLNHVINMLKSFGVENPLMISALKGDGVENLILNILNLLSIEIDRERVKEALSRIQLYF
ncbi:MAG: GTPase [Candidatus Methanomethylicia archaeon]